MTRIGRSGGPDARSSDSGRAIRGTLRLTRHATRRTPKARLVLKTLLRDHERDSDELRRGSRDD